VSVRSEFFERMGLFTIRQFLDAAQCAEIRNAARSSTTTPSMVLEGADARLDQTVRKTLRSHVPADVGARVLARVGALKPSLERHFGIPLGRYQDPQFLVYRPGDFFAAHADAGDEDDEPEFVRKRRVSVVIFLTSEMPAPDDAAHCGGALVFYGLIDDERAKRRGLGLTAEAGLLVAFDARQRHSVNAVTAGERVSIVCWFEADS
jgi:predicted 2-oxoglutarate/Fe(II)-dependent dioxygenase YbiX